MEEKHLGEIACKPQTGKRSPTKTNLMWTDMHNIPQGHCASSQRCSVQKSQGLTMMLYLVAWESTPCWRLCPCQYDVWKSTVSGRYLQEDHWPHSDAWRSISHGSEQPMTHQYCCTYDSNKQAAALLTAKGHITAAYQIRLRILTAQQILYTLQLAGRCPP